MASFGKDIMQKEFLLNYQQTFLNQGSYGSAPRRVIDYRKQLISEMESQPDAWFRWNSAGMWTSNVEAAAEFVNSSPQNIVLVNNTTTGVNSVLRSLDLKPGDGILLYAWTYFAVKNTADYVASVRGLNVYYVDHDLPLTSVQQLLDTYEQALIAHPSIKIVIIDHISSVPAALMPITKLIALCRQYNKLVLVDGAHTPGQVDLHLDQLGVDFYVGNLHKWAYAPRGCAILWVDPKFQKEIFPVVTSHLDRDYSLSNFSYLGTADYTTYYCVTESIKFYRDIGGFDMINQYCETLVTAGAALLVERWGTRHYDLPLEMRAPYMRMVRLPDLLKYPAEIVERSDVKRRSLDMKDLMQDVWEKYQIQSVFVSVDNEPWCRLSASVYNELGDYEKLAQAILDMKREGLNGI